METFKISKDEEQHLRVYMSEKTGEIVLGVVFQYPNYSKYYLVRRNGKLIRLNFKKWLVGLS